MMETMRSHSTLTTSDLHLNRAEDRPFSTLHIPTPFQQTPPRPARASDLRAEQRHRVRGRHEDVRRLAVHPEDGDRHVLARADEEAHAREDDGEEEGEDDGADAAADEALCTPWGTRGANATSGMHVTCGSVVGSVVGWLCRVVASYAAHLP